MKNQVYKQTVEKKKVVVIGALFTTSIVIMILGASFSIFSLAYNIGFTVLNSHVHGAIFGGVVTFLGIRYFLAVQRLKLEVYRAASKFSWNNFKKVKKEEVIL